MALSQPWTAPLAGPLIPGSPYAVVVLQEGYSRGLPDGSSQADGTVSLVLGPHLTLVDTGGPWGRERLLASLARQGVSPGDIRHVVCTHGHSDHVGNLNLFPRADLTVGTDFSQPGGRYLPTGLRQGAPFLLDAGRLEVLPTPGHTGHDVSLLVRGTALGDVLLAGDLFEREADEDPGASRPHPSNRAAWLLWEPLWDVPLGALCGSGAAGGRLRPGRLRAGPRPRAPLQVPAGQRDPVGVGAPLPDRRGGFGLQRGELPL